METNRNKLVVVESPFGADNIDDLVRNVAYAMLVSRDSFERNEVPLASHLIYTLMLDDTDPVERMKGIDAGLTIGSHAELTALYKDLGVSRGMEYGIENAKKAGRAVVSRMLFAPDMQQDAMRQAILEASPVDPDAIAKMYGRILQK